MSGNIDLKFPHVCIVEASAGSGKTYALAKRYVELLINPRLCASEVPIKNILAITFSNKAALEMKERILDFLKKIALDCFEDQKEKDEILSSLSVGQDEAKKKALLIMEELLRNYNFFQVKTIDSFINAILSGCALKLGLSASFRIRTDYAQYISLSLDRLIDRAAGDKRVALIFEKFLEQYLYLDNKSSWFPRKDIFESMKSLFFKSSISGAEFVQSGIEARDIMVLKKEILGQISRLANNLPEGTRSVFSNSLAEFLNSSKDSFDLGSLPAAFKKDAFPINKNGELSAKTVAQWKAIRKNLKKLAEAESLFVFNPSISIYKAVFEDFCALSRKDDVVFLEELNRQARGLFDEAGVTVPELYYRLSARLLHFLIDEFQDTSLLQWKNLDPMVVEALSKGGSLFYVGDKKQAIYRFRGGDASLFDSVGKNLSAFLFEKNSLMFNYRSKRSIVEFFNDCFSSDNLRRFLKTEDKASLLFDFTENEEKEILSVFENASQDTAKCEDGGYVCVEALQGKTAEERRLNAVNRLRGIIDDAAKRFDYRDMAILVRENVDVEFLTERLIELNIPVESEKTLNIRNNAYIKELLSFFSFLNSPIDDLSFASFILGDIFSKVTGRDTKVYSDFLFEVSAKKDIHNQVYLYREFREKFPVEWQKWIEEFFKSVGFVPLYEFVITVYKVFGIPEKFASGQGFFMKLLELIKEKESDAPGLAHFLEYFSNAADEELYVHVAESDSVKVLTIHKAKGLGFPVVILPFLEMGVRVGPDSSMLSGTRLVLRRISEKYRSFSQDLQLLYRSEFVRAFVDELNAVYVALTRASDELYIQVPEKCGNSVNPAYFLMPWKKNEIGKKGMHFNKKVPKEVSKISLSRYEDWIGILKDEFPQLSLSLNRDKRMRGEVVHFLLSFIGDLDREDKNDCIKCALGAAKNSFKMFDDWKDICGSIDSFIENAQMRRFFYCSGAQVLREKEVVDSAGNTRRIDRIIVKDKDVWVVDYKSTNTNMDAGRRQVLEYMRIVSDIYPKKIVKGFLLSFDEMKLEEVHG